MSSSKKRAMQSEAEGSKTPARETRASMASEVAPFGSPAPQPPTSTDRPRHPSVRVPPTAMPPPPTKPAKPPVPESASPGQTPKRPLDLRYTPRPAVGGQRAEAMARGQYVTPYKWAGDTFEDAGRRPEPYFPQGWPGWSAYRSSIDADKPEDEAQRERERARQREDLARRRGRSPELRMMEDKPRKR
ncbi:hypothetical protein DL767_011442 [Monosporascus sp. MG133]|nr:hypothetical protein DL767_011442 [Monosporascus sp. MG133]